MHRQIAGKLTGPVTKWLVVVVWLGLAVVGSGFAQKLSDVQNNEASSWLPGDAESTQALDKLAKFQDPDDLPTTIVYYRKGGLTDADKRAITEQAKQLGELDGVDKPVADPISTPNGVSANEEVVQTLVTFNYGSDGWNRMPDVADEIREIAPEGDGLQVHIAGSGGQAADSAEAF